MNKYACAIAILAVGLAGWAHGKPPARVRPASTTVKEKRPAGRTFNLSNGYVVTFIGAESDDGNEVRILREGRVLKRMGGLDWVSLGSSCFFLPAATGDEPLIKKPDQDITGDGVPDVVIREYAGGMRKLVTDHVFGLTPKKLVAYKPIDHGFADPNARYFVKGRHPSLDVETYDWSLAPLFSNMFETPTPRVRLCFYDGEEVPEWAFANAPRTLTEGQKAELLKHASGLAHVKGGPMGAKAYRVMVEMVAQLIYSGNAEVCREYVRAAFHGRDDERTGFLIELAEVLKDADMGDRLLAMNESSTWGELLSGRKGQLRTDGECACDDTGYWHQQGSEPEPTATTHTSDE